MKKRSTLIITIVLMLFSFASGVLADKIIKASDVLYDTSKTNGLSTNVQGAIDELYSLASNNLCNVNSSCDLEKGTEWTFDYTGKSEEFTVPCNGNYTIELWGASGGVTTGRDASNSFGKGAYTNGEILLKRNSKLFIYVGGQGITGKGDCTSSKITSGFEIPMSFNGGGGLTSFANGSSGGGATDVRLVYGVWNEFESLKSRIMISAGGGGAGGLGQGGSGGALTGISGNIKSAALSHEHTISTGGTQVSVGTKTIYNINGNSQYVNDTVGEFGVGGHGAGKKCAGSGGGGGYYGGAGVRNMGGAGGGSSFISGHNGCDAIASSSTLTNIVHTGQANHYSGYVFKNTVMIDGAGYRWTNIKGEQTGMPTHDGKSTMTGNTGNGYAKITYIG